MYSLLLTIFKTLSLFKTSYSNTVFKDPLSKEDEEKYIDLWLNNKDKKARDILIEHNLRLVAHIVKKYEQTNNNTDDLISIGTIGLIKGINSFSKGPNVKLATYAARCIENELLMHFRKNKKNNNNISLDEPIGYDKEGNDITILDVLKTTPEDYTEDLFKKESISYLNKCLNSLDSKEKEIIIKRYGLYNNDEKTQKEIAKELNISRSYVSRIEKRAITKIMRDFIKNNKYKE